MKATAVLLAIAFTVSLSAQSVSIVNLNNAAISPSVVVGDTTRVTISGATPSALVTLNYNQNGIPGSWNAGYTDGSGFWQYSEQQLGSKVGLWYEQWTVNGGNVGPLFNFEIFDKPTSLTVLSVTAASPNPCGNSYNGGTLLVYGPGANIKYQIMGSTGAETVPSTGLGIMLEPEESDTFYPSGSYFGDIGTDSSSFPWHPPSAKYAASTGIFYDVPVARCSSIAYSYVKWANQVTYIYIGNNGYQVRSQDWYASSSSPGHGFLYSSTGDISYTQ